MSESGFRFIEPPQPNPRIVAIELTGQFSADDMRAVMERIEKIVERGEKVLMYQDMKDYDGVDVDAITEKFKHMGTLWKGIEKAAVLGDSRWLEIYIGVADVLTPQQFKYFPESEKAEAFAWLTAV